MQIAKVIGTLVSTQKNRKFDGANASTNCRASAFCFDAASTTAACSIGEWNESGISAYVPTFSPAARLRAPVKASLPTRTGLKVKVSSVSRLP